MDSYYESTTSHCRVNNFKKITKLLQTIYPSNPESLLYGYLHHSNEGKKYLKKMQENLLRDKTTHPLLTSIKEHLLSIKNNTTLYNQTKELFLKLLKKAKFTRAQVHDSLEVTLSNEKWWKVKHQIAPKKRGNKPIGDGLKENILNWANNCTDDSIIRKTVETVKRTKKKVTNYEAANVLAVTCCFKCLYKDFIADSSNNQYSTLSYSSFLRNLPKNIKKSKKKTDLCELCLHTNSIRNKKESGKELSEKENSLLQIGEYHKTNALLQRNALKTNLDSLEDGQAVVIFDFKQNIKLGGSPNEVSHDYYSPSNINYLSFFVKTKSDGIFFDFSSEVLAKDAYFVIGCFKKMLRQDAFKALNIKEIFAWSDVGRHFRNGMMVSFFARLEKTHKIKVVHNFFVESHGKFICDVHFSQVII